MGVSSWFDITSDTCDLRVPSLATILLLRLLLRIPFSWLSCKGSWYEGMRSSLRPPHLYRHQEDGIAIKFYFHLLHFIAWHKYGADFLTHDSPSPAVKMR